jgi:hypothetical protein
MRAGGVLIVLLLSLFLWRMVRIDKSKHHVDKEEVALMKGR